MRLKGVNLRGLNVVNYNPLDLSPITVPYNVKQHKYGAVATWSHCTDLYTPTIEKHGIDAEINALKYNLQMTVFAHWQFSASVVNELKGFSDSGKCRVGSYEYTGKDYADGKLTDETYMDYLLNQYKWIEENFGYYPSVGSYGYGLQTFKEDLKQYYLGIRNSAYVVTDYNYDIADTSSFMTTTRQADMSGERATVLTECSTALSNAITNGGWYRDFTHWHNCTGTMLADYFRTQRETISINNVAVVDFLTAIEYMKFRQSLLGINFYTYNGNIYISAETNRNPVLSRDMETTLSVQIDLTGTILAGKDLSSNFGIQKVSENVFIAEVPYNGYAILSESVLGEYLDFDLPTVTSASISNGKLTVATDKETKVTVFAVPSGTDLYNATLVARDNVLTTNHSIDISLTDIVNNDIYIGCITKENQSILQVV